MLDEVTLRKFAPIVLRFGLVALFLLFGYYQVTNIDGWTVWVPSGIPELLHMSARTIVLLNGGFELVAGTVLALGVYVRWIALLLGLHLLLIAYEVGSDIGIRDFSLAVACFSLSLYGQDEWTLMRKFS